MRKVLLKWVAILCISSMVMTGCAVPQPGNGGHNPTEGNEEIPDNPDTPTNPDVPDTPDNPDQPENPDVPENPEQPDAPVEPEKPADGENVNLPAEPRVVRIEVESAAEISGAAVQNCSEDDGQEFGGINSYGYAKYANVDFGRTGFVSAIVRAGAWGQGGTVEFRADALEGEGSLLLGTCEVTSTGDWSNYESFGCVLGGNLTGTHDVYIVFRGNGWLYNLNWFELYRAGEETVAQVSIGEALTGAPLQATVTPENASVIYEWYVDGVKVGNKSTYMPTLLDLNKEIKVKAYGYAMYSGEAESVSKTVALNPYTDTDFDQMAYDAFTGFINKYYTVKDGVGKITAGYFWDFAEMYEVVIDAYEHTGEERYKNMIDEIYRGFTASFGTNWAFNEFNDDVIWMTIACARAYEATGNQTYLDTAINNFNIVYDRAWSEDLGGGLWWKTENQSKNACVNCPAAIAACLLGEATGDDAYYQKAKGMLDWVVSKLYNAETGCVYDNMTRAGVRTDWDFTYNQGTFVGAATLLGEYYKSRNAAEAAKYVGYAAKTCDYTIVTKYHGSVMNDEGGSSDAEDSQGFKGILPRWFYLYAVDNNQPMILEWMKLNAAVAWSNRNSDNIIWTRWGDKTEEKNYYSFGASTAVAMLQNVAGSRELIRNGQNTIQAESFVSCRGITRSADKKRIAKIKDGYYTIYKNVDFGSTPAIRAKLNASAALTGGSVEIRLDNPSGELIGTATIANTGSFAVVKEFLCEIQPTAGIKDICLVFRGNGNFLFELDSFSFTSEALEVPDYSGDGVKSAYNRIELESFSDRHNGVGTEGNDIGGTSLAGISNGYYTVYRGVDFGTVSPKALTVRASAWDGGVIEVRDGAVDGPVLCSCDIQSTGDWMKYRTFNSQVSQTITGTHDLYLVFVGGGALYNLDWFEFIEQDKTAIESVTISDGSITVGDELTATVAPADATVNFEWYIGGVLKSCEATYKVVPDDVKKSIQLLVTGYGDYAGTCNSNITAKVSPKGVPAYTRMEAENYDEKGGNCGSNDHELNGINTYGYAAYKNLDFGDVAPRQFTVRAATPMSGGVIEVRADALEGDGSILLGSCDITYTGDWSNYSEFTCALSGELTGIHTIYLVFRGNGYLFNIDWFELSAETTEPDAPAYVNAYERIEAENFVDGVGYFKENTSDVDGNEQLGGLNDGEFVTYAVDFGQTAPTEALFRASAWDGGRIELYVDSKDSAENLIGSCDIPQNNDWNSWATYSCNLSAEGITGQHTIYLVFKKIGNNDLYNINWFQFVSTPQIVTVNPYERVEAESFAESGGVGLEGCQDEGGGTHLAGINTYGYAKYNYVDFGEQTPVWALFRASSDASGGNIKIYVDEIADNNLVGTCAVTPTGGWGNWQDFSCNLTAPVTGVHTLYLVFEGEGYLYNFNWFVFSR
ncbi:MAG: carbohydrate-binding protein [Acetatifactor sp.]|nr:carbohydrate-binding protein [Acetatifactor sp.]